MPKTNEGTIQEITRKTADGKTKKVMQARYQFFDATGKRKSKTKDVANRTEGKQWLKQMAREHEAKKSDFGKKEIRFLEFTEEIEPILKDRKSVDPMLSQLKVLREFFGRMKLSDIKYEQLEAYRDKRRKEPIQFKNSTRQRSDTTIAKEFSLLSRILKIAKDKGRITEQPFYGASPLVSGESVEREAFLSEEEEAKMLESCILPDRSGFKRESLKPVLVCAIDTAMRRGEILKLEWRDIDFKREIISVRRETTKANLPRTVPLTARLKQTLETIKPETAKSGDRIFKVGDFKKAYAWVREQAGVKLTFHDLRHIGITRVMKKGFEQELAMKISGHTVTKTFLRYLNPEPEYLVEKMRRSESEAGAASV
ncbi:MAG TPA: site-specific integrase [Pyrinomonadaceae bacterium]|jgi:integrase